MPARIGTFGVCPTAQPDPLQTSKEPILPTHYQNVKKYLTLLIDIKINFITFDTIVKKYYSK